MCFNKTTCSNFTCIYLSWPKSRLGGHIVNYIQQAELVHDNTAQQPIKIIYKFSNAYSNMENTFLGSYGNEMCSINNLLQKNSNCNKTEVTDNDKSIIRTTVSKASNIVIP